jgi:hypothetical protein
MVKEMVTTESAITVRSNRIPLVHVLILIFLTLSFLEALLLLAVPAEPQTDMWSFEFQLASRVIYFSGQSFLPGVN